MSKNEIDLKKFVVFQKLEVGPAEIEPSRIKIRYRITKRDSIVAENELIYTYKEDVFEPSDPQHINLASIIGAQVALNYGLFCEELLFDGLYDDADQRFLLDMAENTAREIYVNKLLQPNEFIKSEYLPVKTQKQSRYCAAKVSFQNTKFTQVALDWTYRDVDRRQFVLLSSGGKDSLLSYGLLKEMGQVVHPVFINESGRHWYTAMNAYKHLKDTEPNTAKVWCNSDRIFNWMLRQMPFIKENYADIRSDIYPIRLWTVAVFLFGALPIAIKTNAGNLVVGNEYDTTSRLNLGGVSHYAGLYDQSKYFDNNLTRYFLKKGYGIYQFSILRSLSEMLIMKVLVERYPELQKYQVSCHAAHQTEQGMFPCGKCEKCRRIVGMLSVLDANPANCGYNVGQVSDSLKSLSRVGVKQIGPDAAHLYHLLLDKDLIEATDHVKKLAKNRPYIMKLRFDSERSTPSDIPTSIRKKLFEILLKHTNGAVQFKNGRWVDVEIMDKNFLTAPYKFQLKKLPENQNGGSQEYRWEKLTWEEVKERVEQVDTAILPCGAIEQHGPHLPVDIDYFDAVYLADHVAEACSDPKPFVLPPIPYGVSYHHEDFKGTLSVTNDSLSRFVYDIGMSLAKNGIKKIIILNGHGDNAPTLSYAAQMINRDAGIFVCVDTGETSDVDLEKIAETHNDIHAGEIETSTTLAVRPEVVQMEKAVNESLQFGSKYLDFSSERGVAWYVQTSKISKSGILGDPTKASAKKGKKMWKIMIAQLVKFVEEIKKSPLEELYQKRF